MLQKLLDIDHYLFLKINQAARNSFFDAIMPFLREPKIWAPFYLFIIIFSILNFGKKALWWLLAAGACVTITDTVSSKIIKPLFARPRPCMDADFASQVRLLATYCGGNGSFTSSHAANHFGLAVFFFVTLHHILPKYIYLVFVWALLICVAQIYVGVHYPSDILGGAFIGWATGKIVGHFYNKHQGLLQLTN